MVWFFWALLGASLIHIGEEYVFPGGVMKAAQWLNPPFGQYASKAFHIFINSLFILLVLVGALVGEANLVFSLAIAFLLLYNAFAHLGGTLIGKRYMPGLISGLVLYLPLSVTTIGTYACAGKITAADLGWAAALGALFELFPGLVLGAVALMNRKEE